MPERSFDPIPTRHSLLNRLKDWGDQTSWQDFFDTYWELIYNVAIKAGLSRDEAEEVVQETVIAVARKIGDFKADPSHGSFSAWLMQLTRWRIGDQWRKRRRMEQASVTPLADDANVMDCGPNSSTVGIERIADPAGIALDEVWHDEWEKHLMGVALEKVKRQVSPRQYQMFDLHVLQKKSVTATASILEASMASVYMAKQRVGRLLKKEIHRLKHTDDAAG